MHLHGPARRATVAVLLAAACALPARAQVFTDVTATALAGVEREPEGGGSPPLTGGAAAGDCDGDGWPDLFFTGFFQGQLYRNRGDGTFENATAAANLLQVASTRGAAFADVDNDGDLDLYATAFTEGSHFLWINQGDCTFEEEASERGVAVTTPSPGRSVSFGDYDRDGYLDLYVAELKSPIINPDAPAPVSHLFHNRGAAAPGFFDDVTIAAGVAVDAVEGSQDGTFPFTARFTDFDRDGWPDLAVISDFYESRLFWNDGDGTFTDGTIASGVGTDEHGMGATTGDFDGDGLLDLFVTSIFLGGNPKATGNRLYRYVGERTFADVTESAGVRDGMWGWGTEAFDYDNDGDLDLVMTNGVSGSEAVRHYVEIELGSVDLAPFAVDPLRFWRNEGGGVFSEVSASAAIFDDGVGQGVIAFDYDADGDLDVLVTHDDAIPPRLFRNDGGNANHWLDVELEGRRAHPNGVGAIVTLALAGGTTTVREVSASSTYLAQNGTARVHFGLGPGKAAIDSVRVDWPAGNVQTVADVEIDTLLRLVEECLPPLCEPTPTMTPSPTPTSTAEPSPSPTATSQPSPTPTPTSPSTPSPTLAPTASATSTVTVSPSPTAISACIGDCTGDSVVTVAEVVTTVGIALGRSSLSRCGNGDPDRSGTISVEEIVGAVVSSQLGCGEGAGDRGLGVGSPPTPSP